MGLFSDIFMGRECKYCGKHSLKEQVSITDSKTGRFSVQWCSSCHSLGVYDNPPKCRRCKIPMTSVEQNEYGVYLPQCPNCGWIYD